jgi:hypothetical protein
MLFSVVDVLLEMADPMSSLELITSCLVSDRVCYEAIQISTVTRSSTPLSQHSTNDFINIHKLASDLEPANINPNKTSSTCPRHCLHISLIILPKPGKRCS